MGRMFFYDIMLLYHRYEEYLEEDRKYQEKQQAEYEDKYNMSEAKASLESMRNQTSTPPSMSSMPSMPSMPSIPSF